jgi:NhaP-type Na+/H+ or K+/H+ antiporter
VSLFSLISMLITLAAVSSYFNYRYIKLPTTIGVMLFGALISPTDPIAVLAIMKSVGASQQIESQIAGESLFNDGLGVVIFLVLLQLSALDATSAQDTLVTHRSVWSSVDLGAVGLLLLKEVGGGVLLASAAGYVTYQMLKRVCPYVAQRKDQLNNTNPSDIKPKKNQ